jgi:hypothetical protein
MYIRCPYCKKRLKLKDKQKNLIRCAQCTHFVLNIKDSNYPRLQESLNPFQQEFLTYDNFDYIEDGLDFTLTGYFSFNDSHLNLLKEKSKKAGVALEKYLKNGSKSILTPEEKNILYKLKAEDIEEIDRKIFNKVMYLKARIECIKLLKILEY